MILRFCYVIGRSAYSTRFGNSFSFQKGCLFGGPSRAKFFFSLSGRFHQMLEGPAAIGFFAFSAPTSFAVGRDLHHGPPRLSPSPIKAEKSGFT